MQQSKWPLLAPIILGAFILGCGGSSAVINPPNPEPPVITSDPGSLTVFVGEPASFTVAATGPNLTYQWLHDGNVITGATGATFNIAAVTQTDAGAYVARVSNRDGVRNSAPATLTVRPNRGNAGIIVD